MSIIKALFQPLDPEKRLIQARLKEIEAIEGRLFAEFLVSQARHGNGSRQSRWPCALWLRYRNIDVMEKFWRPPERVVDALSADMARDDHA